jgi:hypothetical protein
MRTSERFIRRMKISSVLVFGKVPLPPRPSPTGYPRRLRPGPSLPPPSRHCGHTDPTFPHPLFSDAVGVVFRCWFPTSRCRARLTLRSTPTRTRRALFGRHAAADDLRRIICGCLRPPGANSISSFCSNDSLGRPHLHSPSLACRVFLIKKPYSSQKLGRCHDGLFQQEHRERQ